ncbi:hypothetical protein [Micromonospora sp. M42]|nr:hypothetical protein [Micromonospora sp. M42]
MKLTVDFVRFLPVNLMITAPGWARFPRRTRDQGVCGLPEA